MIYFRDYHWLPVQGYSRFDALIQTDDHQREDVFWMLDFRCVAAGPEWRRVREWERPTLWLAVNGFKPKLRSWRDLGTLNYWNWEEEMAEDEVFGPSGWLDVAFYPKGGSPEGEKSFVSDGIWRVAGREGGWLTVELAAFADGRSLMELLQGLPVQVTPDGREDRPEPDLDFWKQNAQIYLLENIPFGTVTVRVPRNVRDAEAYAVRRARALIGVDEPEHIQVQDFLKIHERHPEQCPENIRQDLFVELHFNGYYED